jgi:hypothetical protein
VVISLCAAAQSLWWHGTKAGYQSVGHRTAKGYHGHNL